MGLLIENLTKNYVCSNGKTKQVLDNINFQVNDGDLLAIRGKSGAGKSTFMHILGLLDQPTEGKYFIDNEDIFEKKEKYRAQIRNEKFGFVLQDFGLMEGETVFYNVAVPLLLGKCKMKMIRNRVEEIMDQFHLLDLIDENVSVLSGGEKQRVAIARAIINNPSYILADEPTGALDEFNAQGVMDILKGIHKMGHTVIVITHDQQISEQCARIVYMRDGKLEE